jgi:hypothetical protein
LRGRRPPATPPSERPPAPARPRPPAKVLVPFAAGALLLIAVALAVLSESGERRATATQPPLDLARNSVAAVDSSGTVRFASPLPGRPTGLIAQGDTVWVITIDSRALVGIDVGSRSIVRTVPLRIRPDAVAVGAGAIWIVDGSNGRLARVEPGYERSTTIRFRHSSRDDAGPASVAVAGGGVWIADGRRLLTRVEASTRAVTTVDARRPMTALAAGAGAIWAVGTEPAGLVRVDPATRAITDTLPFVTRGDEAAPNPAAVVAGREDVWVLNTNTASVTRVDPTTRGVRATIPIGVDRVPNAIATDGVRAWVANEDGTLSRIDPGATSAASVWVGESLRQVAATGARLWVATTALDDVLPGGAG